MTSARRKVDSPAPQRITRVAARRVFRRSDKAGQRVTLTIGVPRRVARLEWGCAVQITGLTRWLSHPRFVFGVDGVQALHLAMQFASLELELARHKLQWLGETADLGLPRFLPGLPAREQDRLQRIIDREVARFRAVARRRAARRKPARGIVSR